MVMSPAGRILSCLLAGSLLLSSTGCATINLTKIDFRSRKASARNPVVKIICLWEPAEGTDPNGVPCHGFAGQIFFVTASTLSVSVAGDIKIYEFDNLGTPEEQAKPIHEFNFDSPAWQRHYTYGTVGPAYNVFVPYMKRGVNEATCALRVRYTPKDGSPVIFSELTELELLAFANNSRRRTTTISMDGKSNSNVAAKATSAGKDGVVQASHQVAELTDADVRIAQLEQMVRELKALQEKKPISTASPVVPAAAAEPAPESKPPRRLDELEESVHRIKPRTVNATTDQRTTATPKATKPAASQATDSEEPRVATRTRPHPLDDTQPVDLPLRGRDVLTEATSSKAVGNTSTRQPSRRHPLDDEESTIEKKPSRKTIIRASDSNPDAEQSAENSIDPFEPIDTEVIETTAVDDLPVIRKKLRSAHP
jgi:hypothetical protein